MLLQHNFMPLKVMVPRFGYKEPIVGVEIGVLGGVGSVSMLQFLPNLTLYSIDPWRHINSIPGKSFFESELSQHDLDENYETAKARTMEFGKRAIIVRKTSDEAVNDVPPEIDYVFIDGDHSYDQVLRDLKNYATRVRSGGIVAGHDYINQMGVAMAVDEYFNDKKVHLGDDDTWWTYVE